MFNLAKDNFLFEKKEIKYTKETHTHKNSLFI